MTPHKVVMTQGVAALVGDGLDIQSLLERHRKGDWGDVCPDDAEANNDAVKNGARLLSAYKTPHGKIWIITEADRSATTVLLPSEY